MHTSDRLLANSLNIRNEMIIVALSITPKLHIIGYITWQVGFECQYL